MIMYVVFSNIMVPSVEYAYHSRAQKDEKGGKEGILVHWSLLCGYQGFGLSLMQVNQKSI